jgi:phage-related minor tail protein
LARIDRDLETVTQRLEEKTNESNNLLQELEVMKSKVALTMADTARYKEEERLLETKIAAVRGNTRNLTSPPASQQQQYQQQNYQQQQQQQQHRNSVMQGYGGGGGGGGDNSNGGANKDDCVIS